MLSERRRCKFNYSAQSRELCDTQIRCTDKGGTVAEPTFQHVRAGAVTAD